MSKLRPVEEVAYYEADVTPGGVRAIITQDRQAIHTLLGKGINEMLHRQFMKDSPARHQNDAFLKVLTLIDKLFSDKK